MLKVNTHLKEKLSVDLPDADWNWYGFCEYAKQVRRDLNGDGQKDTYITKANKYYSLFLDPYLCNYVNKVSGKADFNNDMFIDLLNLWKKLWEEDLIKAAENSKGEDETVLFTIKSAGYNMGNDEYTCFPAFNKELKVYPGEAQFLCASSVAKNTELAVKFPAKWMSKEV